VKCEHFIKASRAKLKQLLTRSLAQAPLSVILIDGTIFKSEHRIVAIGIDRLGNKIVLGMDDWRSPNAQLIPR
jgi:hypothetical protein